jgi:hypothetical protein
LEEVCQLKQSDLEQQLEGMGRDLMRKLLQAHLDSRQPGNAIEPVGDAVGTTLTPTPARTRRLETIFGTVELTRTGYRAEGESIAYPLDRALNLPQGKYSLEVRRRVAIETNNGSFEDGLYTLEAFTGVPAPKREFEELVILAAQDFEAFYVDRQKPASADPHTGPVLVLAVDGKGVVIRPEDLRQATQGAAAKRAETFTARQGGSRWLHPKRMTSVAAIYTVERFVRTPEEILPLPKERREKPTRRQPEHKRLWTSPDNSPEAVITAMIDEAEHRDPKGEKRWVALVDGNRTQIDSLHKLADERKLDLIIIVDFIHVALYVWKAALALFPDHEAKQDRWVRARLLDILRGKASLVAAGIGRSATLRAMAALERQPVDHCADYLRHCSPYLQYDKALAEGVPVATGVIEGACRHLVEDPMNLVGAGWSLSLAEAVLRLRALHSSRDFDAYWKFHVDQEYTRNYGSRSIDHSVPEVALPAARLSPPSRRPLLKLIKKKAES